MGEFKVMLARGRDRLEIEGTAEFVEARLEQLLRFLERREEPDLSEGEEDEGEQTPAQDGSGGVSLRSFVAEKKPSNLSEAIACVLFFFKKHRQQEELT